MNIHKAYVSNTKLYVDRRIHKISDKILNFKIKTETLPALVYRFGDDIDYYLNHRKEEQKPNLHLCSPEEISVFYEQFPKCIIELSPPAPE